MRRFQMCLDIAETNLGQARVIRDALREKKIDGADPDWIQERASQIERRCAIALEFSVLALESYLSCDGEKEDWMGQWIRLVDGNPMKDDVLNGIGQMRVLRNRFLTSDPAIASSALTIDEAKNAIEAVKLAIRAVDSDADI